jgi:PST family polysaccharide transporter
LGIDQAFAQYGETGGAASGTFAVLSIATGLASLAVTFIAVPILVALGYPQPVIVATLVLAGVGAMDAFMGIAWVHLDKALQFTRVSLVTALAFPVSYVPAFYLALHGGGYWALLAQTVAYSLLLLVGLWFTARRTLQALWQSRWSFSSLLARRFLRFGILVGLAAIFATIVYKFDNFLVGTFTSLETLGYYDRAYRIAQWSSILIGSVLTRTAFFAYSRLQNDPVRLTRTAQMSLWLVTMLALPIALALFVSADHLILVLFGDRWLPSAQLLRFLGAYSVLRPLLDDATSLFIAVGHPRRTTIVIISQAIALVVAGTPLTLQFGAVGTALGVGTAFAVGLTVTYYFVRRTLPQLSLRDAFMVPLAAVVVTVPLALSFSFFLQLQSLSTVVKLLLESGVTIGLYLSVSFGLRPRLTLERSRYVWRLFRTRTAT